MTEKMLNWIMRFLWNSKLRNESKPESTWDGVERQVSLGTGLLRGDDTEHQLERIQTVLRRSSCSN